MNSSLILILAIFFSATTGGLLGMLFTKLKSKSEQSTLKERNSNLTAKIEELKQFHHDENEKQDIYYNSKLRELYEMITKIENEREIIRNDKNNLNAALVKRNTEYENLKILNEQRDEEIALRQTQLKKDFEILATKIFYWIPLASFNQKT